MKTDVKEKRKKKGPGLSKAYVYARDCGLPLVALIFAYIGFKIRDVTAAYKTFLDPDTFFHYEMYRQAISHWIPKYYAYAYPPAGIKAEGYLGLYTMQALFYKVTHALFGTSVLGAFKLWPPFVGAMIVIAVYLIGWKLHSNWAGFWGAAMVMFSTANITKTYSGNNRGEGPFMMFFLFAVFFLLVYIDEKKWNWKKISSAILFLILSPIYMGVWNGSELGVMVLLTLGGLYAIGVFIAGRIAQLKRFTKEYLSILGVSILLGLAVSWTRFIGIGNFLVFAFEVYLALLVLVALMLYGRRLGLKYSDKLHRLGTVSAVLVIGFLAFYGYFGRDLFKFLGQATQSSPLYQTVAELAKTSWSQIAPYFSIRGSDGLVFFIALAGFFLVLFKLTKKLKSGAYDWYKETFIIVYYLATIYLLLNAIRFSFQASGPITILAGILIGEAFVLVERMKESAGTKALYAIFLTLLFIPMPYVGASYAMTQQENSMAYYRFINPKMPGSVPESWMDALSWIANHSSPYDTVMSWWDYGYWEESSLLSHRRAVSDGGHGYDRRYIIARFFSRTNEKAEVDLEAWEDKYVITFLDPFDRQSDFGKFGAIAYLGGAINYGEYRSNAMFGYVQSNQMTVKNNTVLVKFGNAVYEPYLTIDLTNGKVYHGKRAVIPYVLYITSYGGILAYKKIAFSDYVRLALALPFSLNQWDAQKLFANFKLVYTAYNGYIERNYGVKVPSVRVYEFRPFGVYRIDVLENKTWVSIYSTLSGGKLPTGEHEFRLWISAFGRDIKDGKLVFEAYNGTKLIESKVVVENLNMNYLNETPVILKLNVPRATKYRFILIQKGPVGVTNGPVYVNGKLARPSELLKPGESGTIKLTEAFDKAYKNVQFTLRGVLYYYVAPNGTDIYKKGFYLEPHMEIVGYVPVKTLSVKKGDNIIEGKASLPADFFNRYLEEIYKKYGRNKVVIVSERVEPIFLTEKAYIIWEG
ncbi:STT3 domain-containing protein [Thermococcus sp.]|uniref:STT3 domain-containing protein n=1 Tax=Thermococcus sp. TaxID=35749 RepID=UPI0026295AD3|nr:STT3 domain-containing protein [Thermococcus sp.]